MRRRLLRAGPAFLLAALFVSPGCNRLLREPEVIIRPACSLKVLDYETGFPLAGIRVTLVTLYGNADTVGRWTFTTDAAGSVEIPSARVPRKQEVRAGRGANRYRFIASFEGDDHAYYSQSVTGGEHTVYLSREYLLAGRAGRPAPAADHRLTAPDRQPTAATNPVTI